MNLLKKISFFPLMATAIPFHTQLTPLVGTGRTLKQAHLKRMLSDSFNINAGLFVWSVEVKSVN